MVLQYSNQETSVTIGESVRDEDGMLYLVLNYLSTAIHFAGLHPPGFVFCA